MNQQALSAFIWSVADRLRGDYRQPDYVKVNRHFYIFEPPHLLAVIGGELSEVIGRIQTMLRKVM
jgi:hypothetical protein